jgi:hypothetical protein
MARIPTEIENCGRCGGRHKLKLKQFTRPILDPRFEEDVVMFSHYADCPKMGQPILALVKDDEKTDEN